ncbi:21 kDa protein-like [Rhodamnia argentea]|uniref:21 kDa protein-like n=1 Tax=Rhodamnia argentea TaxID=178133 RepID=A0A8B8PJJ3_9MYRT|nr:21 kDa protein-like [Rhodamnia argentea]
MGSPTSKNQSSSSTSTIPRHALAISTTAIFILFSIGQPCLASSMLDHSSSNAEFIKTSCGFTIYPDVCYRTLSSYASTIQTSRKEMANAALSVTLESARSASNTVAKLSKAGGLSKRAAGAVIDCVETISDSVDEIRQSLAAMKGLDGPEFEANMSNIQTWVSAALTDEDTCMDGFQEGGISNNKEVKGPIRNSIVRAAQLTSNALALINRLQ